MSTKKKDGAYALVKALETAGVRRIFTLSGNHIMPVYDAIFDSQIDLIHTRHEAAAVHMADAWARLSGEIGVALVTGGPGHANAIAALYTAGMAESPVLLLSGHAPIAQLGKGSFQEMQQAEIAAPLTKAAWICQKTEEIASDIAKGIRLAKSGRPGPVHISLPTDVIESLLLNDASEPTPTNNIASADESDVVLITNLINKLKQSSRPLILTGPQMQSKHGKNSLLELQNTLGIPVIGMESPRGIGDPSLGLLAEVLNKADCVLLLGKKVDFTLKFGQSPGFQQDCIFLQIDPEEKEINRAEKALGKRLFTSIILDIPSAIQAILHLPQENSLTNSAWQQEVAEAIHFRPAEWLNPLPNNGRIHPIEALAPLQEILDSHPDSVLVCDGGEIGQWAQACLTAPNRIINGVAGSIGAGLPFATAASLAKPNTPIVAIMGDGTFGFHSAEIDTAVRYKLPFTLVIGNDARWNAEYQIQVRDYGQDRTIGCELLPTHYEKVCEAFGGYGELVDNSNDILPAVKRAIASQLPACINIMIDSLPAPNMKRI